MSVYAVAPIACPPIPPKIIGAAGAPGARSDPMYGNIQAGALLKTSLTVGLLLTLMPHTPRCELVENLLA